MPFASGRSLRYQEPPHSDLMDIQSERMTRPRRLDAASRSSKRHWRELPRRFRPANTIMQVLGFIDPNWLVEFEADAIVEREAGE